MYLWCDYVALTKEFSNLLLKTFMLITFVQQ